MQHARQSKRHILEKEHRMGRRDVHARRKLNAYIQAKYSLRGGAGADDAMETVLGEYNSKTTDHKEPMTREKVREKNETQAFLFHWYFQKVVVPKWKEWSTDQEEGKESGDAFKQLRQNVHNLDAYLQEQKLEEKEYTTVDQTDWPTLFPNELKRFKTVKKQVEDQEKEDVFKQKLHFSSGATFAIGFMVALGFALK